MRLRRFILWSLVLSMVAVSILTGWLVVLSCAPELRRRCIQTALAANNEPPFWWPADWRDEFEELQAMQPLLARLKQPIPDNDLRPILKPLGKIRDGRYAVPKLVSLLDDEDSNTRQWATLGLVWAKSRPDLAGPALQKTLQDNDTKVRQRAIVAILSYQSQIEMFLPALAQILLHDPDTKTRNHAFSVLKVCVQEVSWPPNMAIRHEQGGRETTVLPREVEDVVMAWEKLEPR